MRQSLIDAIYKAFGAPARPDRSYKDYMNGVLSKGLSAQRVKQAYRAGYRTCWNMDISCPYVSGQLRHAWSTGENHALIDKLKGTDIKTLN